MLFKNIKINPVFDTSNYLSNMIKCNYPHGIILVLWECVIWKSFPGGSVVKNPSAKQETWVWSLGREVPLEKEMATHSSILAW